MCITAGVNSLVLYRVYFLLVLISPILQNPRGFVSFQTLTTGLQSRRISGTCSVKCKSEVKLSEDVLQNSFGVADRHPFYLQKRTYLRKTGVILFPTHINIFQSWRTHCKQRLRRLPLVDEVFEAHWVCLRRNPGSLNFCPRQITNAKKNGFARGIHTSIK